MTPMIDLSKLSPAPWSSVAQVWQHDPGERTGKFLLCHGMHIIATFDNEADCDEAALSRNAFQVMMDRGWYACRDGFDGELFVGYIVCSRPTGKGETFSCPNVMGRHHGPISSWPDPFTALVEADKWYRENVENVK